MTNRNFADVVRRDLANNPELAAMVEEQRKEEAEEHAELLHRYMLELAPTPITGEWLERIKFQQGWRETDYLCPSKNDNSVSLLLDSIVIHNATLGQLRTACRLMGVKMPELKEAGNE